MTNELGELRDRTDEQAEREVMESSAGPGTGTSESGNRRRFLTKDEVVELSRRCHDRTVPRVARATGCSIPTLMRAKSEVGRSFSAPVIRQLRAYLSKPEGATKTAPAPRAAGVIVELEPKQREWLRQAEGQLGRAELASRLGVTEQAVYNLVKGGQVGVRQQLFDTIAALAARAPTSSGRRHRAKETRTRAYPRLPQALYVALRTAASTRSQREVAAEIGLEPSALSRVLSTRSLRATTLVKVQAWYEGCKAAAPGARDRGYRAQKLAQAGQGNKVSPTELRAQAAVLRARADGLEDLAKSIEKLFG